MNSKKLFEFERKFSKYIGSQNSVMVNSGSSANLLMIAALFYTKNPKLKLKRGYKNIPYNLIKCYKFLSDEKLTHPKELKLLNLWIKDMKNITIHI